MTPVHLLGRVSYLFWAGLLLLGLARAAEPQRIVSLNLCTDAMLLELVEPGRIASLTYLSRNPDYAAWAGPAGDIPINHGLIEEILPLDPDLILAGDFGAQPTIQLLQRLGYRVERFAPAADVAGYRADLRRLAALVGAEHRAERLLLELDTRLAALAPDPNAAWPQALVYGANGFTSGSGSLIDDLLRHAGLNNLAADLGIGASGRLSLEQVLLAEPMLIITGEYRPEEPARAQLLLRHPALAALLERPGRQLLSIPANQWNCPGPPMIDAVETLSRARQELADG